MFREVLIVVLISIFFNAVYREHTTQHVKVIKIPIHPGLDVGGNFGLTPLHLAVIGGHKATAKLVIQIGLNVNARDKFGRTPLFYLVGNNKKAILDLLVEKGADINTEDNAGFTPLHSAFLNEDKELIELLIEKGADLNAKDDFGMTPKQWEMDVKHQSNTPYGFS